MHKEKVKLVQGFAQDFVPVPGETFDIVFEDAFSSDGKPTAVYEKSFLQQVKTYLKPKAVYISHCHNNTTALLTTMIAAGTVVV